MQRASFPLTRRSLLAATPALLAWPALATDSNRALQNYEMQSGGRIGVYARNFVTGAMLAWRADERFIMCSTFKASLAGLVLARVDGGEDALERMIHYDERQLEEYAPIARKNLAAGAMSVGAMCEGAVAYSDNTCANLLLTRVGGPTALTAFWRRLGDPLSRLDHDEPLLNRSLPGDPHDTTTPRVMSGNLHRLTVGNSLSPSSRQQLITWLVNNTTGGDRLRAGLPKAWLVGDKTGNNGKDAFGDLAVVWPRPGCPILVCAYTQGGSPTPAQVKAVFAEIGRMVSARLA